MRIVQHYTTGSNLYLVVTRLSDGYVLDFSDNTFKSAGWTTPYQTFSSIRVLGAGESIYTSDLDLDDVNASLTVMNVVVTVLLRSGGSPEMTTDARLTEPYAFRVAGGVNLDDLVPGNTAHVEVTANITSNDGTAFHATARLVNPDGTTVEIATIDPTATCEFDVTMDATTSGGNRSAIIDADTATVGDANSDNVFEWQEANPNFTAMRGFLCKATIVSGGTTYEGTCPFSTQ